MPGLSLPPKRALLPWPLPALGVWAVAYAVDRALTAAALAAPWALLGGVAAGIALAWPIRQGWRRTLAAAGFPLAALLSGIGPTLPAASWLAALLPLALLYPLRAWRDAPFFPSPADALAGLDVCVTPAPKRVLDAGCGLGHGLVAVRRVWPGAELHGIEWSRPLAALARWRCRWARVRRADMWRASWAGYEMVYLFQRPESMARALAKARSEWADGGWLVSLEFPVPGATPHASLQPPGRRPVWIYRIEPARSNPRSTARRAGR